MEVHSAQHWKLLTFEFNDFDLTDDETISASIRIFLDLNFLDAVHTKQEVYRRSLALRRPFCRTIKFSPNVKLLSFFLIRKLINRTRSLLDGHIDTELFT